MINFPDADYFLQWCHDIWRFDNSFWSIFLMLTTFYNGATIFEDSITVFDQFSWCWLLFTMVTTFLILLRWTLYSQILQWTFSKYTNYLSQEQLNQLTSWTNEEWTKLHFSVLHFARFMREATTGVVVLSSLFWNGCSRSNYITTLPGWCVRFEYWQHNF